MKKIILILIFIAGITAAQDKTLTLQESMQIGLSNSKELKISNSKVISADAKITEATSHLLPQLSFSAGYTRLSNIPPFEISVPIFPNPIQISPVILNNYNLKLTLQQPIFTGLKLWSLKSAANSNYKATELEYSNDLNETAFNIQSAFWNYYKVKQLKELLDEDLKQIKTHLDDTKNFLKNGLATQNDVLKLEVQYSNVKLKLIEAENNIDVARINFNRILNLPLESKTDIQVNNIDTSFVKYNLDSILKEAKEKRNDLKSLQYRVDASDDAITAANSGWFPSIYLIGNYYYNKPNQRIIPAVDKFKETWDVSLTLNWTLWNWGYTSSQTTQAEQNKVQAETSLEQLKDAVGVEVYQSFLSYNRSLDKINVSKQTVEQAEENYRIMQQKYNQQVATSTDLIDAEVSVLQAKTNLTNSLVDFEIARIKLEKSIGRKIY